MVNATNAVPAVPAIHSSIKPESSLSLIILHTGDNKELPGYRYHVAMFREVESKTGKKSAGSGLPNMAIYLPAFDVSPLLASEDSADRKAASAILTDAVDKQRTENLRSRILELHAGNQTATGSAIDWADNTLAACLTSITTASANSRMTKDAILAWFDAAAGVAVTERALELAATKGITGDDKISVYVATILANYREKYAKAAATVPAWQLQEAESLAAMLEKIGSGDPVATALATKIGKYIEIARATSEL